MIGNLIQWSIKNRVMVVIITTCIMGIALWAVSEINIDALPDLSDVQVIIRTEYPGQTPGIVEDQVTYPLTTALLGIPNTRSVRGFSMVGSSFVYVIFEDGTDIYWARSRVLEQLNSVNHLLPEGISPQLGPDATGVGWIYQYVLVTGGYSPDYPQGLWYNKETGVWFTENKEPGLEFRRILEESQVRYFDPSTGKSFDNLKDIPKEVLPEIRKYELKKRLDSCPITGKPLKFPDLDLADLRSLQDWYLRYELTSLQGVSEVASVGGFVRQYQVIVDPDKLRSFNLSLQEVKSRIRSSNLDSGGRLLEMSENEYMVNSRGLLGSISAAEKRRLAASGEDPGRVQRHLVLEHLGQIAVAVNNHGIPVSLSDVADVVIGPDIRRGIAEWNGQGETVGGIVVMRYGENARETIRRVEEKLDSLKLSLPPGVDIHNGYDRSDLIDRAVSTLTHTLVEEILIVAFVCILFLIHVRSAMVAVVVLPAGVLISILIMNTLGITANIMSLGGIAIAIGVMVDSSVIMVENAHNHLAARGKKSRIEAITDACMEVGPTLFFSLMIITISFLPVFALQEQSGRLFKPLAFTKTFSMGVAALLAVTLIPALIVYFVRKNVIPERTGLKTRIISYLTIILIPGLFLMFFPLEVLAGNHFWFGVGWILISAIIILPQKIFPEENNPLSRVLIAIYNPFFIFAMKYRWQVIVGSVLFVLLSLFPLMDLGTEFMPPLEEGDFLYMPNADPGLSITKAKELLQQTDKLIKQFPEVISVMGKIGRAETATDPAPLTMIETTIMLERDKNKWRQIPDKGFLGLFPHNRPITMNELVDGYNLENGRHIPGINDALNIPGLTGALSRGSMPIKTRIDMLSTGIRTAVGIKVMGDDLEQLSRISGDISQLLKTEKEISRYTASAYAEKSIGGNYIDININREKLARYGLALGQVQEVIASALGGMNITYTIEGREKYPVNLRYPAELRDNIPKLKQTLIKTPSGAHIPLVQVADLEIRKGPPMIKSENARLTSWVFVEIRDIDVGTYVEKARDLVRKKVPLLQGYTVKWSGQFEYMEAASRTLAIIVPIVLIAIMLLLYLATRSWFRTVLILVTLTFSAAGAIWMVYFLGFNLSVAVWVGIIALVGLDAETSLVMLLYLDNSVEKMMKRTKDPDKNSLWFALHEGAVKRIRPKTMTVVTTFAALLPLMFATGAGSDTMKRLAAPMIGGLFTSFVLELLIYPVIMYLFFLARMKLKKV